MSVQDKLPALEGDRRRDVAQPRDDQGKGDKGDKGDKGTREMGGNSSNNIPRKQSFWTNW